MKVRDVIKTIERDGWRIVRQRGSHRQFKHRNKPGLVTIAGKESWLRELLGVFLSRQG